MPTKSIESILPAARLRGVPDPHGERYASGTLWPHGEWSYGYGREKPDGGDWHENPLQVSERAEERIREDWALARFPLDLSDAANSTKRPPRGQKGITGYGQQMIKACGFLMGQRWPQHRKTLGTVTLPPMSEQARREVVAAWPDLTRELLRWLGRQAVREGVPPVICSVTEVQPKRLQAHQEGCLHWHVLWLNRPAKAGNWTVEPNDLRAWLDSLLRRKILSYQGGHINVDTKRVQGEAARYLAKYMSKGKQQVAEAMEDWGEGLCPRTWWNMTAPARKAVKAATMKGRAVGTVLEDTFCRAREFDLEACYAFIRPVVILFDEVEVVMGWRGRFVPELDRIVRSMLSCADIVAAH